MYRLLMFLSKNGMDLEGGQPLKRENGSESKLVGDLPTLKIPKLPRNIPIFQKKLHGEEPYDPPLVEKAPK